MIPKAFFSKGMGTFCRKSGGRVVVASSPHISLPPVSSFRAKREIFLTQRSNGERQMRSSRSTHAILSLPHKYRVPLRRKRSLGYARDDDTRERAISHSLSFLHVEGCPAGQIYPPPSARPFFKGLHNGHVKTLTLRKVSSPISSFRAKREIYLAQRSNGERQMRSSRST